MSGRRVIPTRVKQALLTQPVFNRIAATPEGRKQLRDQLATGTKVLAEKEAEYQRARKIIVETLARIRIALGEVEA
ncbi:MAG: hypothetical protein ACREO4_13035 [Lysobacter sp.]